MAGRMREMLNRFLGRDTPAGFSGSLAAEEIVLAAAELMDGGHLVATSLGLWLPAGDSSRRLGWHLISKATWRGEELGIIEAEQTGMVGAVVLLTDRQPVRFRLARSGRLPDIVHARVTGSIKSRHHRDLPGGGAWFVQRQVPGEGRLVLQVRADPGTDRDAVRSVASQVGESLRGVGGGHH
ncbi:MAG TPA: hypothetical protein VF444_13590 [Pseudonocardiaceae bacterium]